MAKRVMVVDDSRMTHLQMKNLLADSGEFEVAACCSSGEEAVEKYGEVNPDVVTMDIIMPGMDGLEASQAILEEHPEAKIIMVSSLAYDDTFQRAKAIGARGFVDKPFHQEQLLKVFEEALA